MCRAGQFAPLYAGHGARAIAGQVGVRRVAVRMSRKALHAVWCASSVGAPQGQRAWARRATFLCTYCGLFFFLRRIGYRYRVLVLLRVRRLRFSFLPLFTPGEAGVRGRCEDH